MKVKVLSVIAALMYCCFSVAIADELSASKVSKQGKEALISKSFGAKYTIDSKVLAEQRELFIHLPESYATSERQYPVFYVLDGAYHFKHAVLSTEFLAESGKMPEAIVVAIPNNTGQRMRDAYEDPHTFLDFIEKEVLPFVSANYQTSGRNILFGHSAMGMVTLKAFANRTQLFDHYIASSSAMDSTEKQLFNDLEQAIRAKRLIDKALYFSIGEQAREGQGFSEASVILSKYLEQNAPSDLHWQYEFIAQQNHTSVAYLALFKGLSSVFADYEAPALSNYQSFIEFGGIEGLTQFFNLRGKKYQSDSQIPYHVLTGLAFSFLAEDKSSEGIALLEQQVDNYQNPTRIYGAIAFLYEQQASFVQALSAYKQALYSAQKLSADDATQAYYQSKIEELQNKGF